MAISNLFLKSKGKTNKGNTVLNLACAEINKEYVIKSVKTEDEDLKEMNDNLIAEGEKTIANIDEKLKKLDEVPKDAMTKTQEEFIKTV